MESFSKLLASAYHRYGLASLLIQRGVCTLQEAWCLLYDHPGERLEIERRVSNWLLDQFQKLPKGREASGVSPVRRHGLLSSLDIADLAIAMLDYECAFEEKPSPSSELIDLLGQLSGVTRHRKSLTNSDQHSHKFRLAAQIDGQAALTGERASVRQLAKLVSVSIGTIVTWRRSARYKELVSFEKQKPFFGGPPPPRFDAKKLLVQCVCF